MRHPVLPWILALASATPAQQLRPPADPRVPVHTMPDDPGLGPFGTWAAGSNYKVAFDDGVTFYPWKRDPVPWRWRTEEVRAGDRLLLDRSTARAAHHTGWRYELATTDLVEAYDVQDHGVEQTFTLMRPPGNDADLVVVGAVTSPRRADAVAAEHTDLVFRSPGAEDVRYGAAAVLDAAGRRAPIDTSHRDGYVTLTVPAAWLRGARYPVVIDPVVSTRFSQTSYAEWVQVAHEEQTPSTLFVREKFDDLLAYSVPGTGIAGAQTLVFSDISNNWRARRFSATSVAATGKWLIAFDRKNPFGGAGGSVHAYLHDFGAATPNSGSLLPVDSSSTTTIQDPAAGGQAEGSTESRALVAFGRGNEVLASVVDTATGAVRAPFRIDGPPAGTTLTRKHPRVNQLAGGNGDPWFVVWQERNMSIPGDDNEVEGTLVAASGQMSNTAKLGRSTGTDHKRQPWIDGRDRRYVVSYVGGRVGSLSLEAQRVDWPPGPENPTLQPYQVVNTVQPNVAALTNYGIAYDPTTGSHWNVVYREIETNFLNDSLRGARLGHDAQWVERYQIISWVLGLGGAGLTFSRDADRWLVLYSVADDVFTGWISGVLVRHLATPPAPYGQGCGAGVTRLPPPHAGSSPYPVRLSGAPANAPAALLLGLAQTNLPLAPLGGGTCALLVQSPVVVPAVADTTGTAQVAFTLPSQLGGVVFSGTLYAQWAYRDPAANPLGVVATEGRVVVVQ